MKRYYREIRFDFHVQIPILDANSNCSTYTKCLFPPNKQKGWIYYYWRLSIII